MLSEDKRRRHMELMHGSGNVFRDFGIQNADAEQLRALLAAQIIIRRARLDRFTIDRLMTILSHLDRKVEVTVTVRPTQGHHIDARP
jgi:hypothetical protein